jgi:hypothetical protein
MPKPKPLKGKLKQDEFYCVCCRKKVKGGDIRLKLQKNYKAEGGKVPMLKSSCKNCDCHLNKFVKRSNVPKLKEKYGMAR